VTRAEANRKRLTTHGMSRTRVFRIWSLMLNRCRNPRATQYAYYGGRGITVCDRWLKFACFLEDMGLPKEQESLDRIDSNGSYDPGNCRWASKVQQANNCRSNRVLVIDGESMTMAEASRRWGRKVGTIWQRLQLGWSDTDAAKRPTVWRGVKERAA
jgi:hypothetical protein